MAHFIVHPAIPAQPAGHWCVDIVIGGTVTTIDFPDKAGAVAEVDRLRKPALVKQAPRPTRH